MSTIKAAPGQVWKFDHPGDGPSEVTLQTRVQENLGVHWSTSPESFVVEVGGTLPNMTFVRWAPGHGPQALPVQPQPTNVSGPEILPLVIADLHARAERGLTKYGVALRTNNGRSALRDLYEEILDAAMYARQELERENALLSENERLRAALLNIATSSHRLSCGPVACLALGGHIGGRQCNEPQGDGPCLHCERCGQYLSAGRADPGEG